MSWRQRFRLGPGEILVLMAIGILALIVLTGNFKLIIETLYKPYTALIVVIMLVEYVLLKGADRSQIYRRELEAARERRRDDVLALREMEMQLVELRARLGATLEKEAEPQGLRQALESGIEVTGDVLKLLRERI